MGPPGPLGCPAFIGWALQGRREWFSWWDWDTVGSCRGTVSDPGTAGSAPDHLRDVLPACLPSTCQPSSAGTCLSRPWLLPTASTSR